MLRPKRRIAGQNLLTRRALGETIENHRDRDAGPFCTESPAADSRVADQLFSPSCHRGLSFILSEQAGAPSARSWSGPRYFTGTRRRNSSNQFTTPSKVLL